ncbi:hypothetical protein evm_006829 [Chilo suppressalis]|nr:hypothetical protein evm_006829 [Chilo suppressalis]
MLSPMWNILIVFVIISVAYGKNDHVDLTQDWWETAVFYRIYVRSFMDSDGDGVGDINGITSRLEYLKEIGAEAAWLSPIFKSPMNDFGYDISDFYTIQPEYGSNDDFEQLLKKANELNIKIVLDFVPNHTSNESEWFIKSSSREEYYSDWYIWENGHIGHAGERQPPNNWVSSFGKSAWSYSPARDQYYLHQFGVAQPDLNYRNPVVVDEIKNIIKFWLEKGIAGLIMNSVNHVFEVDKDNYGGHYPDEPITGKPGLSPDDYGYLEHVYTKDQEETYELVSQLRETGDHDRSRVASRFRPELVDAFNMLVLLLPGIAITYMGEEIGMLDGFVPWSETKDPLACNTDDPVNFIEVSRDPVRTPFPWSNGKNSGFSIADRTWLPVGEGSEHLNVAHQRSAVRSHYQVYRALTNLRVRAAFKYGRLESLALNNDVFAFKRWHNDDTYVIVMNFGRTYQVVNLTSFDLVFGQLEVEVSSVLSSRTYNDNIPAGSVDLAANEALVLRMQA